MKIDITCDGTEYIDFKKLIPFQGDLKKLNINNLKKLKESIKKYGFSTPAFVWKSGETKYILDAHQRVKALNSLFKEGYDIPDIPIVYIHAKDQQEAKEKLLHITSSYGEFKKSELEKWVLELGEDILETIRLADKEMSFLNEKEEKEEPEFIISEELMESHNYVVLYFDNDIDWQTAQEKLNIKSVHAGDSKQGYERKGIGRVLRGTEILDRIE